MLKLPAILILVVVLLTPFAATRPSASGVEITEVKNIGISTANEANSIIQVKWAAKHTPDTSIKSFDMNIEVIYADGWVEKARTSVGGSARSARFEVPTLHKAVGRPVADMKGFKVSVTATMSETATLQGSF